jgi:hypothetical protein
MTQTHHLQYGCGLSAPADWVNYDASPSLRLQRLPVIGRMKGLGAVRFPAHVRYGDIVRGIPVRDGSCRAVYCSHVLEHLSLGDFKTALRNTHRLLTRGAIFRLVVPDLRVAAARYLADSSDGAAQQFMTETFLGVAERSRGLGGFLRGWLGNSQHLWMWDYPSLRHELEQAGFTGTRRAQMGDSEDPMFASVEDPMRWTDAVGIQCQA